MDRLTAAVERHALARNRSRVGRTEEILVEGPSKRDPARCTGRTRQGKLVHAPAGAGFEPGSYASVRITEAAPHWLAGEPRARIPVAAA